MPSRYGFRGIDIGVGFDVVAPGQAIDGAGRR
jgi:hypothetical protein